MELVTSSSGSHALPPDVSVMKTEANHQGLVEVGGKVNQSNLNRQAKVQNSDFRNSRYNASIVAMHRNGERLSGKIGDQQYTRQGICYWSVCRSDQFENQIGFVQRYVC